MIILASGSPRRKQLLEEAGIEVVTRPADIDEHPLPGEKPRDYAYRMALEKARAAAVQCTDGPAVLVSADTSVILDDEILGKPVSEAHAFDMLTRLSGRMHEVMTGVCVMDVHRKCEHCFVTVTRVYFTHLSEERITAYIRTGEPMDKAGAYGIQGRAAGFVSRIEGSYTNVVGLPVCETVEAIENITKMIDK